MSISECQSSKVINQCHWLSLTSSTRWRPSPAWSPGAGSSSLSIQGIVVWNTQRTECRLLVQDTHKLNSVEKDCDGRFLVVDCILKRNGVIFMTIYGPNYDKPIFCINLIMKLTTIEGQCTAGGDFNLLLNPSMDNASPRSNFFKSKAAQVWRTLYPNKQGFLSFFFYLSATLSDTILWNSLAQLLLLNPHLLGGE